MIFKKNKILFFIFLLTCLLFLFLILNSKVLTIRSDAGSDGGGNYKESQKTEEIEMDKIRKDYIAEVERIESKLRLYVEDFEFFLKSGADAGKIVETKKKIESLQKDFTDLLVPPEYRKKHLNQVLIFSKIESGEKNNSELLDQYKLLLSNIKEM